MANDDADFWGFYPDTVLVFPELDLRVDLRAPLSEDIIRFLSDAIGSSFAVITADNPCGELLDEAANESRMAALANDVERRGFRFVRADGLATVGGHRERGLAVATSRDSAIEIATAFEQLGIFWFDGKSFWLVPALKEGQPVRLPID